jgi:hypothetical protein
VYAEVPLRIVISGGTAETVAVAFDGAELAAVREGNDWVADLPLSGLQDGELPVTVSSGQPRWSRSRRRRPCAGR